MPRAHGSGSTSHRAHARMVLNQRKFNEVTQAVAAGLFNAARAVEEVAHRRAPDNPKPTKAFPYGAGEGLPKQGGVLVYVGNKKTHGWSRRGDQPKKPKAARPITKAHSVTALVGFGFPARFNELGTKRMRARPFLSPSREAVAPSIGRLVGDVSRPLIGGNE